MNVKLKVQATEITMKNEYGKKPNGLTDYDNKIVYYQTALTVLDNPLNIVGHLIVREKHEIGSIHEISVNTDSPQQVIEIEGVAALAASKLRE